MGLMMRMSRLLMIMRILVWACLRQIPLAIDSGCCEVCEEHQARRDQAPPYRRRRHLDAVVTAEVPADRVGPGRGELAAQLADQLHHRGIGAPRRGVGPSRPGLERGVALEAPTPDQPGHPRPRHPIVRSRLGVGSPLHHNRHDHQPSLRHGPTLEPLRRFLCPAPSGSYVLNHHTTPSALD